MFSVIIPTMQASPLLWPLLQSFQAHSLVDEILIVNNSDRPLDQPVPAKTRVIYEGPNIYVNPAWNLGAEQAVSDYLIIANDDITLDPVLLDLVAEPLTKGNVGLIGPSAATIYGYDQKTKFSLQRLSEVPGGYGVIMFVATSQYVPIPETMKIYAGEYWLFWNQPYPSLSFSGVTVETVMHTTSGRSEFSVQKDQDVRAYETAMASVLGSQPWHRRARAGIRWQGFQRRLKRLLRRWTNR